MIEKTKVPILTVENLSYVLNQLTLLHAISFTVDATSLVAFLGPNGAGKTTLLKTLAGVYQSEPGKGSIKLGLTNITSWPLYKRVASGLIYVPQTTSLFRSMTVKENLELVYEHHPFWKEKTHTVFQKSRDELLILTSLHDKIATKAEHLSGGQKRKTEVVRALLMNPSLLLLDEPFAGVDPKSMYELKDLFVSLARQGIAIVISDHHVDQLLAMADYLYLVLAGQIVTSGTINDIMHDKHLKERYFGEQFHAEVADRFRTTHN